MRDFFLYKIIHLRVRENCIALFVSGKEIPLQGNHPLFLTWHLAIGSESVAGAFFTGHLFSRVWSAADSEAISYCSVVHTTTGFARNTIVFSCLLKSLRRLENRGDEAPAIVLHLFCSFSSEDWDRSAVCYLEKLYASFLNRSDWTLLCGQPGTGNIFAAEESSKPLSQQCLTEALILLSPAKLSVQYLQTERLLLSPGSPGKRARANLG